MTIIGVAKELESEGLLVFNVPEIVAEFQIDFEFDVNLTYRSTSSRVGLGCIF